MHGIPFMRKHLLTGAICRGGDGSIPSSDTNPEQRDKSICRLIECLVSKDPLAPLLAKSDIDPEIVSKCIGMLSKQSES